MTGNFEQSTRGEATPDVTSLQIEHALWRMDHGFALTNNGGNVCWCNHDLGEICLARSSEPFEGRNYEQILGSIFLLPEEWVRVQKAYEEVSGRRTDRVRIDGLSIGRNDQPARMIDLVLDVLVNPAISPEEVWVAWHFYDVTSYRSTEENLQALLRHSSDGIYLIDTCCRLLVFNPACERITGYDAQDVMHQSGSFAAIFIGEDIQTRAYGRVALFLREGDKVSVNVDLFKNDESGSVVQESLIRKKDGECQWVEINYGPVMDETGELIYLIGIVRDISRRRQMEEQLRIARKLATLGELTSAMAHEIKNPLGIIHSSAEIIMNPDRPEEQRREAAQFICEESRRLDQRMQVFLKFSKPKPPIFTLQSIHRVLTQTIIAYRTLARQGLEVETRQGKQLPHVLIDADQMQQVFLNLLVNADQAMPSGGLIVIATRLSKDQHHIEIEVSDQGPGLPEEDLNRVFEPFYSTKSTGTGMGLSIVLQITQAHNGEVMVTNRDEGGAAFVVSLPAAADATRLDSG